MELTKKHCVPCEGGEHPIQGLGLKKYLAKLKTNWVVTEGGRRIKREYKFKDFKTAMVFVNRVAEIAEQEGHHPDFHIHYNIVTVELWTHAIGGLSENDFILAAKVEEITPV